MNRIAMFWPAAIAGPLVGNSLFRPRSTMLCAVTAVVVLSLSPITRAGDDPKPLPNPKAKASTEADMQAYEEKIEHTEESISMVPIPGGTFLMGSPESEAGRQEDEGPQHEVEISPFWMSQHEITWNQYNVWSEGLDQLRRELMALEPTSRDVAVDGVTAPTEPYTDMSFGMGKGNQPAICMTQHAARTFCKWLSAKTGRYYRLPTEAEWEYACRAGTTTAYSFGDDPEKLGEYAWYFDNSDFRYQKVGQKKPNPWGLYDMHGNVAEWVLDQYHPDFYSRDASVIGRNPLAVPTKLYPRVVRGGSYEDDPDRLRSAARRASESSWKDQDPQIPRSIWYHTDALGVGFRIVRPLVEPSEAEKAAKWEKTLPVQKDPEEG